MFYKFSLYVKKYCINKVLFKNITEIFFYGNNIGKHALVKSVALYNCGEIVNTCRNSIVINISTKVLIIA